MEKYRKLVDRYLKGEDLQGYKLEELENNIMFMKQVLIQSHDPKMYQFCSLRLKTNYAFVSFVVDLFKDDFDFISKVANEYLRLINNPNVIDSIELMIKLNDLGLSKSKHSLNVFALKSLSFRLKEQSSISLAISHLNKDMQDEIGLGFMIILSDYGTSEIITKYFAKSYIQSIFYDNSIGNLEDVIHHEFKTTTDLLRYGVNNFLIAFIRRYDSYLADYVACHIDVLNDIKGEIEYIYRNWESYIKNSNERKINIFVQDIERYMEDFQGNLSEYDVIEFVGKRLGLMPLFSKEIGIRDDDNLDYAESVISGKKVEIDDYQLLTFALDDAHRLFKEDIIDTDNSDYDSLLISQGSVQDQPGKIYNITDK